MVGIGTFDHTLAYIYPRVSIGAAARASIKSAYAAAGIKLMISAFGSTDAPTSGGYDPVSSI
jgi:hypothetical protein